MTQDWNTDEIIEHFTLLPSEFKFLAACRRSKFLRTKMISM